MAPLTFVNGYLQVTGPTGGPEFHLIADDALITNTAGGADVGNCAPQNLTGPAGTYSLGATFAGSLGLGAGYAEYGGTTHQKLWYEGTLTFKGKYTLTNAMPTPVVVVRAFTLTGNIKGYLNNPFIGPPGPAIVDKKVSGKGRAILELSWMTVAGTKVFQCKRVTYHFLG